MTTDGTHPAVGNDPYPNLNAKAIENAAFTVVKGPRGYDQRQVDYYLATCADLLAGWNPTSASMRTAASRHPARWNARHRRHR